VTHETRLVFECDGPEVASTVERAVSREAGDIEGDRTRATVERADDAVAVTVEADDLTALRAGINTWMSLVGVAGDVAGQ
jgi:KEOPS complex subunit Pcc1